MKIDIQLGTSEDIYELERLYNDLNEHLEEGINYPGWKKGVYPTLETAVEGVKNKSLFVAKSEGKIVGSVVLNHEPVEAYHQVTWKNNVDYSEILVIHTLAVHPNYLKFGIGVKLMEFIRDYGIKNSMKCIRLDVFEGNKPAIRLYEKSGYQYIGTVDLGLGIPDLVWFKLYELTLQ